MDNLPKNDKQWKEKLTKEEFHVLREKGTEHPFSGKYVDEKNSGVYVCKGCGQTLFDAKDKYDSQSGWPSFTQPMSNDALDYQDDTSLGTKRTEVLCHRCSSHLGHVFPDGPPPTNQRYCINSIALNFKKQS